MGKGDVFFLLGANPASNHPRLMTLLADLKQRGGKVVVVNPLKETGLVRFRVPSRLGSLLRGTSIADIYIQPHIGGDIAFLTGVAKGVLEQGGIDDTFVNVHCEGWDDFRAMLEGVQWDGIVSLSAWRAIRSTPWRTCTPVLRTRYSPGRWGITHHQYGVQNVQAIANLALQRGMVGRPQAGLLPIRGHSNVQGIGSVGVTPALKRSVLDALDRELGITTPDSEGDGHDGLHGGRCRRKGQSGLLCRRQSLWLESGLRIRRTLSPEPGDGGLPVDNLEHRPHPGERQRDAGLPVLARDEEHQPTTQESMFNFVRLSDGGPERHQGPRSEVDVIAGIGERIDRRGTLDWNSFRRHSNIRDAIARVVPATKPSRTSSNQRQSSRSEAGRFTSRGLPPIAAGARFHAVDIPGLRGADGELRLMTVRSEGQFNTVVYEEEDLYRGQERRDVILLSGDDIRRRGLRVDQPVTVVGEAGKMEGILVRETDITPGNAVMYYPEANVLLSRAVDPASKTPSFKGALVSIEA